MESTQTRRTHEEVLALVALLLVLSSPAGMAAQTVRKRARASETPLPKVPSIPAQTAGGRSLPTHIPPRRTSQIQDGFGINSDLPREPYLPWDRWWWTRMYDAGVKWIRIGQYENSSDWTSWDWVEQKRGTMVIAPELDDFVDSLADNGVAIQVQLMYGNPMYTSPAGKLPDSILPEPGSFHNDDRSLYSIFWPPKTPVQIEAFTRYVKFIVAHFRGRISYWALWNEQDIGYWNPWGNPEEYGRLLKAFVPAVHETDPDAKVIYGAQAGPSRDFTRRALDVCQCASGLDVFAYHTYPGYGGNRNPETMDSGAYGKESPRKLRELVLNYPGIRKDIAFWDDEFNSIGAWRDMDDTVQAKYVPRGLIYNLAAGVKTFVWLLASGTDANEDDDFGLIHGMKFLPQDFTPRPVWATFSNTLAMFSDTKRDSAIKVSAANSAALDRATKSPMLAYGFRSPSGKAIVAYWIAAHSEPGDKFPQLKATLTLTGAGIKHPVLADIMTGEIRPLEWEKGTTGTLEGVPIKDSILAVTDESYFDWLPLPEAPSGLRADVEPGRVKLSWDLHGAGITKSVVERRASEHGNWTRITEVSAGQAVFIDENAPANGPLAYRVRAANAAGESAYSNIVAVRR
jgi:hypothetical protein